MTLGTLMIGIGITALVLTLLVGLVGKKVENWVVSYLQNFTGALFIFSGWVKAIDPLGTAYKMEQYFAEFESTFEGTWFSFLAPMFPTLAEWAASFAVFMIVFEMVLGIMLLVGSNRRFTAWAFFLLVAFFTFLTGFTYLTGYVPEDVNFFQFGKWGPYVETNMKVTDCGCFGDFLKLEPYVSFLKDVFLLVPAIIFLFRWKDMHQLLNGVGRSVLVTVGLIGFTIYCFSNYVWDIPHLDFRPFKENVDVAERKALEEEAETSVQVLAYKMTNKEDGNVVELPFEEFMKQFKDYPKEEWEYEQIKSEPTIPRTKISDFDVSDLDGNDQTENILSYPEYSFMVVAYKLYDDLEEKITEIVQDTVFQLDTVRLADTDSIVEINKTVADITKRQITKTKYTWNSAYLKPWKNAINPVTKDALAANIKVYAITGYAGEERVNSFKAASGSDYPFYLADDILLKTIVRSNPGVVLMKDGKILQKWHYSKLPNFETIQSDYMPIQ